MDMVSLARFFHVGGIPIDTWLDNETLEQLVHHTRFGGGEIVNLLKKGSAYYAPASSIVSMMEAILLDEKRVMPVSVHVNGEYGVQGLFLGVPVILGAKGVEKIIELPLTPAEHEDLMKSAVGVSRILTRL